MKKLLLVLGIILSVTSLKAADYRVEFHIWKSSTLQGGNYLNTMLSSAPVIFHMVVGSPTFNNGGNSYFAMHESSGDVFTTDSSTVAYIPLDTTAGSTPGFGIPYDVRIDSHCYYTKQGNSAITILWDWIVKPSYRTPNDRD